MAHILFTATSAATPRALAACTPVAFGSACVRVECRGVTSDVSVKCVVRSCPSAYKVRDQVRHQPDIHPGIISSNTSNDASLRDPSVCPRTPGAVFGLLHPELSPGRETRTAGDWDQTGKDHAPHLFGCLLFFFLVLYLYFFSFFSCHG